MTNERTAIVMEEVTDAAELADAQDLHKQFDRNSAWLQDHASDVYSNYRGKCICIAGEEVFAADTASEALAQATTAHPHDKGRFVHYIPKEKVPRIYAHKRPVVRV